jgi:MoaA/NifB/PqqE/SkfB family radical SAM enzyme
MNVQIELTTRCNFDCFYCAGRDMPQQDMSLAQYLSIIESHVKRYGVPHQISLQGEGEPTINKAFFEMAAHARRIGSEPFTITNGTYKYPEHFAESFTAIGVSIDTIDPKEAERIGRYNLPRVLEFVETAASHMKVTVFTTVTTASVHDVAAWCRQRGLPHIAQPLQTKPDYQYRYPQHVVVHKPPRLYRCAFLDQDAMRYYAVDGTEMPCCFIKDTSRYVPVADLRQRLMMRQVPHSCKGCRYLK